MDLHTPTPLATDQASRTSASATANVNTLLYTVWRSGTHWLTRMVSDLMGAPAVYTADDRRHYGHETIEQLNQWHTDRIIVRHVSLDPDTLLKHADALGVRIILLFRDLRDVIASSVNMRKHREGHRQNMPPFPDMTITDILAWEMHHLRERYTRTIPEWAQVEHGRLLKVRYETLLQRTDEEMLRIARFLGLDVKPATIRRVVTRHSFHNSTGRRHGQEDPTAHARKGTIGDHRHQFTHQQQEMLNAFLRDALLRMGYSIDGTPR